jgi:multiple sugar transport system substrate-binding protein
VTWIWGDLLAAAEQLARAGDGTAGLYDEGGRLTLQAELANAGVSLGLGTRLDQPTIVAAVGRVQALAARGAILTALSSTEQTLAERIRTGQLGLWPSELSAEATRDGPLPFTTARMPFPLLRDQLLARPLGAMISVGTQHPDAAWRWLSFLSRRQVQPAGDGSAGAVVVPARRSVAVSSRADLEPTTSGAIQLLLERQASTSGLLDGSSASEIALYEALGRVLAEGQSPEDALAEAQAALPAAASAPTAAATAFAVATPVPAQAEGELTIIRFALNNAFGDALIPILDAFQEQNPTIAIDFVAPPELGRFSVPYASVADNAANADCFAWLGPPEPSEVAKVVDLNTLIDADPTFPRDDYWPLALQTFEREGRLTGLPYSLGVPVLWYNMDRFDAAGLPYPTSDWTIEEVLASAEQLTGDGAYGLFSGGWPSLALYLDQVGVALTSGSGNLVQPRFTEPEVVEALGRYVELVQRITPFDGRFTYSEPSTMAEMVELDAAAMAFMGNLMQWGLEYDLGARFGVVMLRDTRPVSYWRDMALYISASSPHIDTCWSWIRHLSESDLSGAFSARRSLGQEALASPQALPGADEAYAIYAQLMEQPRDTESMANFLSEPITQYWLLRALDRVFRHNGSLAAELTEAQFVTEQYLACVQGGEAAATCARQVDPTFAPWVFNL